MDISLRFLKFIRMINVTTALGYLWGRKPEHGMYFLVGLGNSFPQQIFSYRDMRI